MVSWPRTGLPKGSPPVWSAVEFLALGRAEFIQTTRLDAVRLLGRRGGMADAVDSKSTVLYS